MLKLRVNLSTLEPLDKQNSCVSSIPIDFWSDSQLPSTVRSKQPERCERTAEREVSLIENNLALFVHSKPCASFVLLISLTLFTQTLMLLKSRTNSSTRESGHHQTKPIWKENGLNGDNSPKQAVGTMWKNCWTEVWLLENNLALFVYSMSCASFVLLISFTLFTHTRTTLKLFDKYHQPKLLWKEIGLNRDNSPKQAVGTMRKNCGTRSLAAWKQPCTFCVATNQTAPGWSNSETLGFCWGQRFSQPIAFIKSFLNGTRVPRNSRLLTVQNLVLCASKHCRENAPFRAPFPKWRSG